jgi:hypothetical protein
MATFIRSVFNYWLLIDNTVNIFILLPAALIFENLPIMVYIFDKLILYTIPLNFFLKI